MTLSCSGARRRRALLSLFATAAMPAKADPVAELRVVGDAFARVYMPDAQGLPQGCARALINRVAARLGRRVRYEFSPWNRAQALIEQGLADVLVAPYRSPERERRYAFSRAPVYQDWMRLYARNTRPIRWQGGLEELHALRLGVMRGWIYGEAFDAELEIMRRSGEMQQLAKRWGVSVS